LIITNWPGRAAAAIAGRGERQHVVVRGQPAVLDHRGVDVYGHQRSIHLRSMRFLRMLTNSLLAARWAPHISRSSLLQLNPKCRSCRARCGVVRDARRVLRRPPRDLFYVTMLLREFVERRDLLARLDQRAPARVAVGGRGGGRGDADVAQPARFPAVLRRAAARRFAFGAARRRCRRSCCSASRRALLVRPPRQPRRRALLAIAIVGSLALPIAARGRGGEPPIGARRLTLAPPPARGPRITMLLLDGASLEYVLAAGRGRTAAELRRVLDGGASMDLATIRPTQPDPVWAAVATGMYPGKNGVRSAASYYAPGDDRGRRPAARSLLLAHPRAAGRRPRSAELVRRLAARAAVDDPRRLRHQRRASSAGR
jgi:hypothetical protein